MCRGTKTRPPRTGTRGSNRGRRFARCSPRRCRACRRRRATPISISERRRRSRPRCSPPRARRALTRRRHAARRNPARRRSGCANSSLRARRATWRGWRRMPSGAPIRALLWPEVRSIVMLGVNYGPDDDPLAILRQRTRGAISVYARGDDYHDLIKARLKALGRWLIAQARRRHQGVCRYRAGDGKAAGRRGGSRLAGQAHQSGVARNSAPGCFSARSSPRSSCRPTRRKPIIAARAAPVSTSARRAAFPAPYRLDARRCISYLTIEHKGRSRAICGR